MLFDNLITKKSMIEHPKVHYIRSIKLPVDTVVYDTKLYTAPTVMKDELLMDEDDVVNYVLELKDPIGKPRDINNKLYKKLVRSGYKEVKDKRIHNVTRGTNILVSGGFLDSSFKYPVTEEVVYNRWHNNMKTILSKVTEYNLDRLTILEIVLPSTAISKSEIDNIMLMDEKKLSKLDVGNVLELRMLLELSTNSGLLSNYTLEQMKKITLMLRVGVNVVFINLGDMMTSLKGIEKGSDSKIKFFGKILKLWSLLITNDEEEAKEILSEKVELEEDEERGVFVKAMVESGYLKHTEAKKVLTTKEETVKLVIPKLEDSETVYPKKAYIPFDSYRRDRLNAIDTSYELIHEDMIKSMFYNLTKAGFTVLSYNTTEETTIDGTMVTYKVEIVTPKGKKSTLTLNMPKLKDGVLTIFGKDYRMRRQRVNLPLYKAFQTRSAIISSYGSIMFNKARLGARDIGLEITKRLQYHTRVKLLLKNEHTVPGEILPRFYTLISRHVRSFLYKDINFIFDYITRDVTKLKEAEKHGTYVGNKGNKIYLLKGDTLREFYNGKVKDIGDIYKFLNIDKSSLRLEAPYINMFGVEVPAIIVPLYYMGLEGFLKEYKVPHIKRLTDKSEEAPNEFTIRLKDYTYVFKREDDVYLNMLYGIYNITGKLEDIGVESRDFTKDRFGKILGALGLNQGHAIEMDLWRALFIDPFSKILLEKMNEPTEFLPLFIRACEILMDDNYKSPNDVTGMYIRGNNRISALLYKELIKSARVALKGRDKMTMSTYTMLTKLNNDSTMVLVDDSNVIGSLQQVEDVTYLGEGGLKLETMSIANKEFHVTDVGILSEANRDSGNVASAGYSSTDPTINELGMKVDEKIDAGNMLGTSSQLRVAVMHDNTKRMNFISIQDKHTIPSKNDVVLPLRTGYEVTIGNKIGNKYCTNATEPGKVLKVTKSSVTIQYKDKKKKYPLDSWVSKEVSGLTIRHYMKTRLVEGDKIEAGDNITYDSLFFGKDIFNPKGVAMKLGSLARTASVDTDDTYEDSAVVFNKFSKESEVEHDYIYGFLVGNKDKIIDVVNIGTELDEEDILFTVANNTSEFLEDSDMSLLNDLTSTTNMTTVKGKLVDIVVKYKCELKDMSKSLRELTEASDKELMRKYGVTGRVNDNYSSDGKTMDKDKVEVKFFVSSKAGFKNGDKGVLGLQLKYTAAPTPPEEYYTEDGKAIDILFSGRSEEARIVNSPRMIGTTNLLLEWMTENLVKTYFKE